MDTQLDVAVVGAGQAGLAVSYGLKRMGLRHLVLERGEIGESWRSQRWDSFHLNTPNWANGLAGQAFHAEAPDGFGDRDEMVGYLERYARSAELPVRPRTKVDSLTRLPDGDYLLESGAERFRARAVVIAAGGMSRPKIPRVAKKLSPQILSLSAGTYRNPADLPEGAAIVVGSGQSGCQITEDLLEAGRRVYLCASRVGRVPRVYRGRDILAWWRDMGILDVTLDQLENPAMQFAAQPQVSGTRGGHTVSLQSLARDGATLLGRALDADGHVLTLGPDLAESIAFADEKAVGFKAGVDAYIEREGIAAEPPKPDPGEPELPDLGGSDRLDRIDLRSAGVSTVIWCTGFDADWSWIELDVFDERGRPRHRAGVTDEPGLYFVGLPWLSKRKSALIYGASEDAERIVGHIAEAMSGSDT